MEVYSTGPGSAVTRTSNGKSLSGKLYSTEKGKNASENLCSVKKKSPEQVISKGKSSVALSEKVTSASHGKVQKTEKGKTVSVRKNSDHAQATQDCSLPDNIYSTEQGSAPISTLTDQKGANFRQNTHQASRKAQEILPANAALLPTEQMLYHRMEAQRAERHHLSPGKQNSTVSCENNVSFAAESEQTAASSLAAVTTFPCEGWNQFLNKSEGFPDSSRSTSAVFQRSFAPKNRRWKEQAKRQKQEQEHNQTFQGQTAQETSSAKVTKAAAQSAPVGQNSQPIAHHRHRAAILTATKAAAAAKRNLQQSAQPGRDELSRETQEAQTKAVRRTFQATETGAQLGCSGWKLTRKVAGNSVKAGISAVKTAVEATIRRIYKELCAAAASAVGTVLTPLAALAAVVVMVISLVAGVIIPAASPYGLFLVREQEISFSTALNRIASDYFGRIYELEMADDYEEVTVECGIADSDEAWKQILSVYAVGAVKDGLDTLTMDKSHYNRLKDVFWETISVSHRTSVTYETVVEVVQEEQTVTETHYYDATGNPVSAPVLGGYSTSETVTIPAVTETKTIEHKKLHLTVCQKDLEIVEAHYSFSSAEKADVSELLATGDDVWSELSDCFPCLIVSSGGGVGAIDVTAYATVAETVYRALTEEGYTPQTACGILGNIQQECSMNPQSAAGGSYGLCQWKGGRLTNLKSLSGYQTAAVQTGFMISELRRQTGIWRTYGGAVNYTYSGEKVTSLADFKSCSSVKAAAGAFCVCFERSGEYPGNQWYEARLRYAQQWYTYAQSHWE